MHGILRDGERVVDDPVVVMADDGQSAEMSLHGGVRVVDEAIRLATYFGFVLKESVCRAVHSIEQDVLTSLPLARTELGVRVLLAQPAAWANRRKRQRAEVWQAARESQALKWLLFPPTVALVGPPNAGKSTLANVLFGLARSITADTPGTTRDWVSGIADIDGLPIHLIDTAGVRDTNDPLEQQGIYRGKAAASTAQLVIALLDLTKPIETQLRTIKAYPRAIVLINKVDGSPAWDVKTVNGIAISATTGFGLDLIRRAILKHFDCLDLDCASARRWLSHHSYKPLAEEP